MLPDKYAYKNTSLVDIKDEEWEDIPGLDGYFLISNFGRVKRMQYEMQYCNGAIYIKPEKIIKPHIICAFNKFKKDFSYILVNKVTLAGKRYNLSLGRIVYYCFVAKFNLDDSKQVILHKDYDPYNLSPLNLELVSLSEKQERIIKRGRFLSPLLSLSTVIKKKARANIVKNKSKTVTQYTLKGKRIKTFSSMAAAQRATNIFATAISGSASGKNVSAGGFIWRWGDASSIDVNSVLKSRKKKIREKNGQEVSQYDLTGRRIACYRSLQDAQIATGANHNAIRLVTKGVYKTAKGYFWIKGRGKEFIDLSGYSWGHESAALTHKKMVAQYTLDGKYVKSFHSVREAAKNMGVNSSSMSGACSGKQKTCKGYIWRFL